MSRHRLDTTGLLCPLPVIRTQERIKDLEPGDILEVLASDPGAKHDIPSWCRVHGHVLLATSANDDQFQFRIEVRGR